MKPEQLPPQDRGLTAIGGAMALIVVLLVIQVWLLTATLEAYLAGNPDAAVPAAIFSGLIFLCCFVLYGFIERVDQDVRRG